jgi:hypothetical protein
MNQTCLSLFFKSLLFAYSLLCANLTLIASNIEKATQNPDVQTINKLKQQNMQRARELVQNLYIVSYADFSKLLGSNDSYVELGTQAGYYGKEGTDQAYSPLVLYRRVWVHDAGIALSLAVRNKDPKADSRALWLLKNGQYTRDPGNPKGPIFAGWPFSSNQENFGDNWTDCRFITGANACALLAIAEYINSDYYLDLDDKLKAEYLRLYSDALSGILYLIEPNGPNAGLVTAGWSLNVLEEFSKTSYSYNKILDILGYGPREIEGFTDPIRRVRVRNVVTEHCSSVLAVLNYSLKHYDRLFRNNSSFTYDKLDAIRLKLRESIYSKLYDSNKGNFISGRLPSGKRNVYSTIDNASWLSLSLKLDELNDKQVRVLSDSLAYTVNNFTKDFKIKKESYFGAYYFEDGYEDAYIEKSYEHSDALHVEATCSLICGLLEFAKAFPNDPNEPFFRSTASKLWKDLQRFIDKYGFVYASTSVKDISEPIEASLSAIWYLRTCSYFEDVPSE